MAANHVERVGSGTGPLAGRRFAAKDVFDVAGARTGFGHPDWLRTHEPAERTAPAVTRLLEAGASLAGKSVSDELCYSLTGINHHYGAPKNSAAPERTCGGSSSGSASAVTGGAVDFALGTDCGGSVRVPASYCGLYGIRPTHGRIPLDGVAPFTTSFDVVGWFARDPALFETVGRALIELWRPQPLPRRLLLARDAFALVDEPVRRATRAAADRIAGHFASIDEVTVADRSLAEWVKVFQTIQAAEIWYHLGGWIESVRPVFGPGIKERFEAAATVTPEAARGARATRHDIVARLQTILSHDTVLCLPSTPRVAPPLTTPSDTLEIALRQQAMSLLCVAGLGGLPQVSLPFCSLDGYPLGLSLIGPRGTDESLLALAGRLAADGQAGSKVSATPLMQ